MIGAGGIAVVPHVADGAGVEPATGSAVCGMDSVIRRACSKRIDESQPRVDDALHGIDGKQQKFMRAEHWCAPLAKLSSRGC